MVGHVSDDVTGSERGGWNTKFIVPTVQSLVCIRSRKTAPRLMKVDAGKNDVQSER